MDDELLEQLAAIEHERWAGWQRHLHAKCAANENGDLVIPAGYVKALEHQMNTPYTDLSDQEKESDRNEVRRYAHLIRRAD